MEKTGVGFSRNGVVGNWFGLRGCANVAEPVSLTDCEEDVSVIDEVQGLLQKMRKEERRK